MQLDIFSDHYKSYLSTCVGKLILCDQVMTASLYSPTSPTPRPNEITLYTFHELFKVHMMVKLAKARFQFELDMLNENFDRGAFNTLASSIKSSIKKIGDENISDVSVYPFPKEVYEWVSEVRDLYMENNQAKDATLDMVFEYIDITLQTR